MAYKISGGDLDDSMYIQTWKSLANTVEIHWNLASVTCKEYVGNPEAGIDIPTTPGNIIDFDAGYRDYTIYVQWNAEDFIRSYDWENNDSVRDEIDPELDEIMQLVCERNVAGIDSGMKRLGWQEVSKEFHFGGSEIEVEEVGAVNESPRRKLEPGEIMRNLLNVLESVTESDEEWAKSLEREKEAQLSDSDREKLGKIRALMAREKKSKK